MGKKSVDRPSLAFRKNKADIEVGNPPEKYHRVLPYVKGQRVLELGSAEGVLALMIADEYGSHVVAVEMREDRYRAALDLQEAWCQLGMNVATCDMVRGDITKRLELLDDRDTLVAVRSIYYLRDSVSDFFGEVARRGVERIVLCGNAGRARKFFKAGGHPDDSLGFFNYYASREGMEEILRVNGYRVEAVDLNGDPIVVGVAGA